jgi:putative molybdopterin biosynthesis protein
MDGIAVHSQDTVNASESKPVILMHQKDFVYVNTGNPLPEGFDAVIKIEDVIPVEQRLEGESIHNNIYNKAEKEQMQIYQSVFPGLNIRQIGEDIVTHQLILPVNHKIRPIDIGALLAGGVISIRVRRKPRVAIIPTGEELRSPDEKELKAGEIVDFNSRMLSGYVLQWGGEPIIYPVIGDREEELKKTLHSVIEKDDIVTVIAGTSAGSKDFTLP